MRAFYLTKHIGGLQFLPSKLFSPAIPFFFVVVETKDKSTPKEQKKPAMPASPFDDIEETYPDDKPAKSASKTPKSRATWAESDLAVLREMTAEGKRNQEIAQRLGKTP